MHRELGVTVDSVDVLPLLMELLDNLAVAVVVVVDTKVVQAVVTVATMEDLNPIVSNMKYTIPQVATIILNGRAVMAMWFKENTEYCYLIRGHKL